MDLGFTISASTQQAIMIVFILYTAIIVGLGAYVKFASRNENSSQKLAGFLTGGGNLGGVVGLGHRHGRCSRRGSRSRNGLRCRRYRSGRGSRSRGLGRRLGSRNSSAAVPRHTALARGRSSGGSGCRRSGSTSARNERRLLGSSGYGCCRRGGLSSSHARRHGAVGNHGLQACHALGQCLNR